MKALKKKLSSVTLRRSQEASQEYESKERKSSGFTSTESETARKSSSSTAYDSAYEDDEHQTRIAIQRALRGKGLEPADQDGLLYQPFSRDESPYEVGSHGLYTLSSSDTLPSPLPPAVPGVEYGKSSPVVFPSEKWGVPAKMITMKEMLDGPPPVPEVPSKFLDQIALKKKQAKALFENPKADPELATLPKGLNNRVDSEKRARDEEPLKEKVRRVFTPKKAVDPVAFQPAPPPLPRSRDIPTPATFAAPARHIPKILPHKAFPQGANVDSDGSPYGGELIVFRERKEARDARIRQADQVRAHRKASDHYLSLNGRSQINDPLIGRPPPISHRKLSEPAALTEATVARLMKQRGDAEKQAEFKMALQTWTKLEAIHEAQRLNARDEAKRRAEARGEVFLEKIDTGTTGASRDKKTTERIVPPGHTQGLREKWERVKAAESAAADAESLRLLEAATARLVVRGPSKTISEILATPKITTNVQILQKARAASVSTARSTSNTPNIEQLPIKSNQEAAKPTSPGLADGTTPPLPPKYSRYHEWDESLRSGKTPILVQASTPPSTPTPRMPDHSPPPIPSAARGPSPFNALGISTAFGPSLFDSSPVNRVGAFRRRCKGKQREDPHSESDYSDSPPSDDEEPLAEKQPTSTNNSELLAHTYRTEVELAREETCFFSRLRRAAKLKFCQNTFRSASPGRIAQWEETAKMLFTPDMSKSPSFNALEFAGLCPEFRRKGWSWDEMQGKQWPKELEKYKNGFETSESSEDDEDEPVRVGGPSNRLAYYEDFESNSLHSEQDDAFKSTSTQLIDTKRGSREEEVPRGPVAAYEGLRSRSTSLPKWELLWELHGTPQSTRTNSTQTPLPFVRPADIYRRALEERETERQDPKPLNSKDDSESITDLVDSDPFKIKNVSDKGERLGQRQPLRKLTRGVDPKRYDFKDSGDEEEEEDVVAPPIPAKSPGRPQASRRFSSQRGRFPVVPSVQSPNLVSTATATAIESSHIRAPWQQTAFRNAPSGSTSNASDFHPEPRPLRRPLPPPPLRLASSAQPAIQQPPEKSLNWNLRTAFLGSSLSVSGARHAKMESLQVRQSEFSSIKAKAVEDARQMQAKVLTEASKAGKDPPKYVLLELTGKGSFGRVYKGKDMTSAAIVAVKIIDIDESDTLNPRLANSYAEFLKEVNALKILSESKAKNINHVIEALPVGQSMWMICEYCGGGSIATLMKPTAPGGLQEKWIIPILREVAEAIKWVHEAGIIHRDIKCANVLVTEEGGVQLCDFGVAGIMEGKVDKRSTVIGTPHWMAPELFAATPYYGKEVDIWAFGSMVYEVATGLPPNVSQGIPMERLGNHFQNHIPRLEGGNYSNELRDLVAYCLEELPSSRPTIEQVQKHPYIYGTSSKYPTSTLSNLVRAFKMWEDHGGSRKSLFMLGGAQGLSDASVPVPDYEWNFSTTAAFDQDVLRQSTPQDVFEAYGKGVALQGFFSEETSRPPQKASRRRPPPEALARLPAPLEKIFDPNTMSNYEDNSRNHYGRPPPPPASDLPLRDDTAQTSIRDTMIDLDGGDSMINLGGHESMIDLGDLDSDTGLSHFAAMDTIKPTRRGGREEVEDDYSSTVHDFSRAALSDPADVNPNRRTQDWKFPSMAPPASADPELSRFPTTYEIPRPGVTPASGGRPALIHHPTEPVGAAFAGSLAQQPSMDRLSMRESLIDLDMSMPNPIPTYSRPSTANSDTGSATSEQMTFGNPFELERHASLYAPLSTESTDLTEPDYYMEESAVPARLRSDSSARPRDISEISDFSASDAESSQDRNGFSDSDMPPPPLPSHTSFARPANLPYTFGHFPDLPAPPSERALSGTATNEEMKSEFNRMLGAMTSQLESFKDVYSSTQVTRRKGPMPQRRDRKDGEGGAGAGSGAGTSLSG